MDSEVLFSPRPQMADTEVIYSQIDVGLDVRCIRGNNFRKLKLYKMLIVRMQRCSRQEKGSRSIPVRHQMNRTRLGEGCQGEYFIYMDNMDTLKNVYNFRCVIQGFQDKKRRLMAKAFGEVQWCDNKSCCSSFLYRHSSVN